MIETLVNVGTVAPVITLALIHVYGIRETLDALRSFRAAMRELLGMKLAPVILDLRSTLRGIR